MYTEENYFWGLVVYYVGAFLILFSLWFVRKILPGRHFRNTLLLMMASILLVPIKAYPDMHYFAPAWFVSLFEGITKVQPLGYVRGLQPILAVFLFSVVIYWVLFAIGRMLFGGRKRKKLAEQARQEAQDQQQETEPSPEAAA